MYDLYTGGSHNNTYLSSWQWAEPTYEAGCTVNSTNCSRVDLIKPSSQYSVWNFTSP